MEPEVPPPSAVKYALAVGGAVGGLLVLFGLLLVVPVGAILLTQGHLAGQSARLFEVLAFVVAMVLTAGVCAGLIALGEAHAMRRIDERRQPLSLVVVLLAGGLASLFAAGNVAWAVGIAGPTVKPTAALQLLANDRLWLIVCTSVAGPTIVAMLRAARALATPGRTLLILGALAGAGALLEADVRVAVLALGGLYFGTASLARWRVPAPPAPGGVPLARLLGPFGDWTSLAPLAVAGLFVAALGWTGALALAALSLLGAWHIKRRVLRDCPRALALQPAQAPPWFSRASWAALEAELERRGLHLSDDAIHPPLVGAGVLAISSGAGPTSALVFQATPLALPCVTLITCFDGDRQVVTTSRALDGLSWLLRSHRTVVDAWPDAPLGLLLERHGRDVAALQALAGSPVGPGDARAWVTQEAARWPESVARFERVPAPWLLLCAWWFAAPRPVRLRGPLPR